MFEAAKKIKSKIESESIDTKEQLEKFRLEYIGKKSVIKGLFEDFKNVPAELKKEYGALLNEIRQLAENKFRLSADVISSNEAINDLDTVDLSLPVNETRSGGLHPLTLVRNRIIQIFERIGFKVSDGPEIENDWYNFTALNFPENHPAREMQDTFFIERDPDIVLRTHTSNVQTRIMEAESLPIRSIMPGRVFRNEAISARAHCIFHQVEGLYIDKNVGFKDLKDTLYHFSKEMFGSDTKVRFRPSYFPFTEPSAEMDISCFICGGKGCKICKGTGWVEIGGAGMVDPNVLANCNIDPEEYTGFAFGMGIERITMLKYNVKDIRLFFENDIRFLDQFSGA